VKIDQVTDYPFDTAITFRVETAVPAEFRLSFRIPSWARSFSVDTDGFTVQDNLIHLNKTWQTGEAVTLRFGADVKIQPWKNETIVSDGPLLFCLPLDGEFSPGREYAPGFSDAYYTLVDSSPLQLYLAPPTTFTLQRHTFDPSRPYDSLFLAGTLLDSGGNPCPVRFIPLGASILRKVTFAA
jgi:hypothetical protein